MAAQVNTPNPNFDPARHRRLYVDVDVSRLKSATTAAAMRPALEEWRREMLEKSRAERTQELASKRAELSHLEDHIQRLEGQVTEVVERAKSLEQGKQKKSQDLAATRAELAKLQEELTGKKKELDEKQRKQQSEERWYALIPYDGPHGTRRRPSRHQTTAMMTRKLQGTSMVRTVRPCVRGTNSRTCVHP